MTQKTTVTQFFWWWSRCHPSLLKSIIDDGTFYALNRYRIFINPEDTRSFTGRRANSASKFREVICLQETIQSFMPPILMDKIVKLWYLISKRAARVVLYIGRKMNLALILTCLKNICHNKKKIPARKGLNKKKI